MIDPDKITNYNRYYGELEMIFLAEAAKSGKTVAQFDLEIWKRYRVAPKDK